MKASEVLEVLRISRITLKRLRDKGIIKAVRKPNGHYEYDEKKDRLTRTGFNFFENLSKRRTIKKCIENAIS